MAGRYSVKWGNFTYSGRPYWDGGWWGMESSWDRHMHGPLGTVPRPSPTPGCAPAPTAPGTTPCRVRAGLTWAPLCRDSLVSLSGEGGNGTEHKRSSLLPSSSIHSPCRKGQQGKREDWRGIHGNDLGSLVSSGRTCSKAGELLHI